MMLSSKNKLGLALILESHLAKLRQDMKEGVGDLLKGKGQTASGRIERLHESCYVCGRIETSLSKMIENAVYLWEQDSDFRTKLKGQPCLCLRHFKRFADAGRRSLNKKRFADFYSEIETLTMSYLESLKEDVSWFWQKIRLPVRPRALGRRQRRCRTIYRFFEMRIQEGRSAARI